MKKYVIVGDIHYPYHDKKSIKILFDLLKDIQPEEFILSGDSMDMDCISTYSNNKPRRLENKTLIKDYKGFQQDILAPLEKILPSDTKKVFIKGNHEYRTELYLDYYPVNRGIIELENNLDLEHWKIIDNNQYYKLNKDTITLHGIYHNIIPLYLLYVIIIDEL